MTTPTPNEPRRPNEPADLARDKRAALDEFTRTCTALVNRIRGVSEEVDSELGRLSASSRRQRNWLFAIVATMITVVGLVIGLIVVTVELNRAEDRIGERQRVTAEQVLCPLYAQFINSDTLRAREAARAAGQDMATRERAFTTIREGYERLECLPLLRPDGTLPTASP